MSQTSRIPASPNRSYFAMNRWFYKMYQSGLLYHPDESAETVVSLDTNEPLFTKTECDTLDNAMSEMFKTHGDKVYDVCLHYSQMALGIKPDGVLA
jgi:hypothetical protein